MDIYIKRENEISLQEWIAYVRTDPNLILAERGEAVNPITKQRLKFEMAGRTLLGDAEILYLQGRIGCEGYTEEVSDKLKEIAGALGAEVFEA